MLKSEELKKVFSMAKKQLPASCWTGWIWGFGLVEVTYINTDTKNNCLWEVPFPSPESIKNKLAMSTGFGFQEHL